MSPCFRPDILQLPVKWHESFYDFQSVPYHSLIFKPIKSREMGEWFSLQWVLALLAFLWASAAHPKTGSSSASSRLNPKMRPVCLGSPLHPHSIPTHHRGAAGLQAPLISRAPCTTLAFLLWVPEKMASIWESGHSPP